MADIIELYKKHGDFHRAVKESGLRPLEAHIILLRSGLLKIQDKIKYGNPSQKLGGLAEEYFQKLIPDAVDTNKYWKLNNPNYDFMYKGITIDVKFSSCLYKRLKSGKISTASKHWRIRAKGGADLYVIFLAYENNKNESKKIENSYILVIPCSFIYGQKHISRNSEYFDSFWIEKKELKKVLDEYVKVLVPKKNSPKRYLFSKYEVDRVSTDEDELKAYKDFVLKDLKKDHLICRELSDNCKDFFEHCKNSFKLYEGEEEAWNLLTIRNLINSYKFYELFETYHSPITKKLLKLSKKKKPNIDEKKEFHFLSNELDEAVKKLEKHLKI